MTDTYDIPPTDNGDGTWSSSAVTDNGDGTCTWSAVTDNGDGTCTWIDTTGYRDIDITASPIYSGWQVMGTTGYPVAPGPVNNDNGYSAAATTVGVWTAASLVNRWSTGPIWIQES